jgi:hypothetical protein
VSRPRKLIDKKAKKKIVGKCVFCGESDYNLLQVHRIKPGEEGGKYVSGNTVVVCANDHLKIHSGQIKILGKYTSTAARDAIHYQIDGEDKWVFDC